MTKLNANFVGILAGIATGLMVLAALKVGVLSLPLIFFTPIAIYIASMGWGNTTSIIACVVAGITCLFLGAPAIALTSCLLIFAPAAWVGHLTNLGRQNEDGSAEWYPISNIFLQLTLIVGAACVVMLFLVDFRADTTFVQLKEMMAAVAAQNPDFKMPSDEDVTNMLKLVAILMPILASYIWLFIHSTNAGFAAYLTKRSGMLVREYEDIASALTLHKAVLPVTIAAAVGTYLLEGILGQFAGLVLGLGLTSFAMLGLAGTHIKLRGNSAEPMVLFLVYASILLLMFPILYFTVLGITRFLTTGPNGPNINHPNF